MKYLAKRLTIVNCGGVAYNRAFTWQRKLVDQLKAGNGDAAYLLFVEHPPVITIGRRGSAANVLASSGLLKERGVEVAFTNRGGDVTYHGPGQLVGYPIIKMPVWARSVHGYIRGLEELLIVALRDFGIEARQNPPFTGVWVNEEKIAAIGVAFSRWVTSHGFALNVSCDLSHFRLIHPCGMHDTHITSLSKLLGWTVDMEEVRQSVRQAFLARFPFAEVVEVLANHDSINLLFQDEDKQDRQRGRFPPWLRKKLSFSPEATRLKRLLGELELATVCVEAKCPNLPECFCRPTATFMVLGKHCTRNCRFCAVASGSPAPVDPSEPLRIAQAASKLGLKHVVITSVTRDDLSDGGAAHFANVIRELRRSGEFVVEVLTPDFQGNRCAVAVVVAARPDVLGHNLDTVPRLYSRVRPGADYGRSLSVLAQAKRLAPGLYTKSGLMLGLGETEPEIFQALIDLRNVGVDLLTLGQYLSPSPRHYPVARFVPPEEFDYFREKALKLGFESVAAGPFVRSSYLADEQFAILRSRINPRRLSKTHVTG